MRGTGERCGEVGGSWHTWCSCSCCCSGAGCTFCLICHTKVEVSESSKVAKYFFHWKKKRSFFCSKIFCQYNIFGGRIQKSYPRSQPQGSFNGHSSCLACSSSSWPLAAYRWPRWPWPSRGTRSLTSSPPTSTAGGTTQATCTPSPRTGSLGITSFKDFNQMKKKEPAWLDVALLRQTGASWGPSSAQKNESGACAKSPKDNFKQFWFLWSKNVTKF